MTELHIFVAVAIIFLIFRVAGVRRLLIEMKNGDVQDLKSKISALEKSKTESEVLHRE